MGNWCLPAAAVIQILRRKLPNFEEYLHLRQLEIEKEKVELIKDNKNVSIIFGTMPISYPVK